MKLLRLALTAMIPFILISVSYCTPATATPLGTLNAYLDAIVAQNPQAMVSYETEVLGGATRIQRVQGYETLFQEIRSYSITNRNLEVMSETTTNATVSASFNVLITDTNDNNLTDDTITMGYYLTKVDGKWLVSDEGGVGQANTRRTEKRNIESAIIALMVDNEITRIPNSHHAGGGVAINDMAAFPDSTSVAGSSDKLTDGDGDTYTANDKDGWVLYQHDKDGDGTQTGLVNYVNMINTTYYYTCEDDGTVRQWSDAAMTTEYTD
jgi:hypothetical protein